MDFSGTRKGQTKKCTEYFNFIMVKILITFIKSLHLQLGIIFFYKSLIIDVKWSTRFTFLLFQDLKSLTKSRDLDQRQNVHGHCYRFDYCTWVPSTCELIFFIVFSHKEIIWCEKALLCPCRIKSVTMSMYFFVSALNQGFKVPKKQECETRQPLDIYN